jgi:type II secretory pathway component PulF
MPAYQYKAMNLKTRAKTSGVINADDERRARQQLRELQLVPTSLKVIKQQRGKHSGIFGPIKGLISRLKGVSSKEQLSFTRNIGIMIQNGIPLTEALLYFENYLENLVFKDAISTIRKDIMGGKSFSGALGQHPKLFNNVYVNVAQVGESSGELDKVLDRLHNLQLRSEKIKAKVISASIYPGIVLFIATLVLLLIFLIVLPTFVEIYEQMGVELPLITQIMVHISDFLRNGWYVAFPAMGAAIYGFIRFIKSPVGSGYVDRISLGVPVLQDVVTLVNCSQFISTLSVSFASGLPITEALVMSAETVSNGKMRTRFREVAVKVEAGQRIGQVFSELGYLPELVLLMIATGEESGDLDRMFASSYDYIEEEVDQKLEALMALMEPAMLLVLGGIVGFVALGIYLPLFGMYENI